MPRRPLTIIYYPRFIPVCFSFIFFVSVSPEFAYRAGLGVVAESPAGVSSPGATGSGSSSGSAPNRPLPPTPDDDETQDKTLVMRKVSVGVGLRLPG